jgi:DNA-binding transcriptional MerR regulator
MKTRKKLIAGLMAAMIIATIGVVYATDQTDGTVPSTTIQESFGDEHKIDRTIPFACNLTTEQQTELRQLLVTLKEQNATPEEIQAALLEKLDEYGVFDTQLDTQIAQTEQRLTILNREKELRDQGYNWSEIRTIIQDEFNTTGTMDMMYGFGFGHGPCRGGPRGFPDQNITTDDQNMMNGMGFSHRPNRGSGEFNPSATPES